MPLSRVLRTQAIRTEPVHAAGRFLFLAARPTLGLRLLVSRFPIYRLHRATLESVSAMRIVSRQIGEQQR
jgi:hypothetical protein